MSLLQELRELSDQISQFSSGASSGAVMEINQGTNNITDYNLSSIPSRTNLNLTIRLLAGNESIVPTVNPFYTPIVAGNISVDGFGGSAPIVSVVLPGNRSFSSSSNVSINFSASPN